MSRWESLSHLACLALFQQHLAYLPVRFGFSLGQFEFCFSDCFCKSTNKTLLNKSIFWSISSQLSDANARIHKLKFCRHCRMHTVILTAEGGNLLSDPQAIYRMWFCKIICSLCRYVCMRVRTGVHMFSPRKINVHVHVLARWDTVCPSLSRKVGEMLQSFNNYYPHTVLLQWKQPSHQDKPQIHSHLYES